MKKDKEEEKKELTLGEKVKEARLSMRLTQSELVGDFITRNMLSKIENDAASPSLKTLEFLAGKLNTPLSYFMSSVSESADEGSGREDRSVSDAIERGTMAYDDVKKYFTDIYGKNVRQFAICRRFAIRNMMKPDDYPKALSHIRMLIARAEIAGDETDVLLWKGALGVAEGEYDESEANLKKYNEMSHAEGEEKKFVYMLLEKCSVEHGDYKAAYEYKLMSE